jgi:hypothetical protein
MALPADIGPDAYDNIQETDDFRWMIEELEFIAADPRSATRIASIITTALDCCKRSRPANLVHGITFPAVDAGNHFTILTLEGVVNNFAKMCKVGHIIYGDRANYPAHSPLLAEYGVYVESMGGAADIYSFGTFGVVFDEPDRTEQLRAFAEFPRPPAEELKKLRKIIGCDASLRDFVASEDRSNLPYTFGYEFPILNLNPDF